MVGEETIEGGHVTEAVQAQRARFESVWQLHRARVWRLVARLTGSFDLADDLTQEVCLRAWQGFAQFRGEAEAFTWFYRVAVNVVLRYQERKRTETVPLDAPEAVSLCAEQAASPEAATLRSEQRDVVWAALMRLPDDLRIPLILQTYEGLKYREIAGILDLPLGTVKSRLHYAMLRVREELKDYAL